MRLLLCIYLALIPFIITAQHISVKTDNPDVSRIFENIRMGPCEEVDCETQLGRIVDLLQQHGYLLATVSERIDNDSLIVRINEGPRYSYGDLDFSKLPDPFNKENSLTRQKDFSPQSLDSLYKEVLDYAERNGYPLATIRLDSIRFIGSEINARVLYESGPQIRFKSLTDTDNKFRAGWLMKVAQIEEGDLYNQESVDQLSASLGRLGLIVNKIRTDFKGNEAHVILETELKDNSYFDGIIGLQQNAKTGKSTLSGYLDLRLANLFKSAKTVDFHWERLRPSTQELQVRYLHPSLMKGTDFSAEFELIRMDSSYLNRAASLAIINPINAGFILHTFYQFQGSSLLTRSGFLNQADASEAILHSGGIGISGVGRHFNYGVQTLIGSKKITGNSTLRPENYGGSSDGIFQWSLEYEVSWTGKLTDLWELKMNNRFGWVGSSELYQNDLFLMGGLQSIRGFNERSFFTDQFASVQVEPHLLISKSSYLLLFWDMAVLRLPPVANHRWIYGWGTGIELESSQSGSFRFLVGWGKSGEQAIDYSNPRIHIGFLSKF